MGPFFRRLFRSEWAPLGGLGVRNFDAGPSQDLNFDPLSWFEPLSFGVKRSQSVSLQKIKEITQWIDQKCMSFDTSCYKNLLLT